MLMIRFQRIGRKNDPAFRIVVLEKTSGPKAGNYVDLVGTYNPKTKAISLQADRIQDWVKKGAQVSPSLNNLLIAQGVITGTKAAVVSKKNLEKNKAKNEEAAAAAKAAEEAANAPAPVEAALTETEVESPAADETAEAAPAELPTEEEVVAEAVPADEEVSAPAEEVAEESAAPEAVEAA